jgi:malate dehydrogenase
MAGKVTVVGAGFYGSTTAQRIAEYNIAEYNSGIVIDRFSVNAGGQGTIMQLGLEADINGNPLSIQKIDVAVKAGKTIV